MRSPRQQHRADLTEGKNLCFIFGAVLGGRSMKPYQVDDHEGDVVLAERLRFRHVLRSGWGIFACIATVLLPVIALIVVGVLAFTYLVVMPRRVWIRGGDF